MLIFFLSFLGLSAPNTLIPYSIFPTCVASSSLFIFRLILFSLWRRPTSVSHLIITSNSSLFLRLKEVINSIAASSAKLLIFTILHHHLPCSSFDPHFQFIPPCQASSSDCPCCFPFSSRYSYNGPSSIITNIFTPFFLLMLANCYPFSPSIC